MDSNSLFTQTLRKLDEIFYATFPTAALHKVQEEAQQCQQQQPAQPLQLHCEYDYPDEVPALEYTYHKPPSPINERPPHYALQPTHPYHAFSVAHLHAQAYARSAHARARAQALAAIHLRSLLKNKQRALEKKRPLTCLFCHSCKIACGLPLPGSGSADKTCDQCQRHSLACEYPSESRRGMRKKKLVNVPNPEAPPKDEPSKVSPNPSLSA